MAETTSTKPARPGQAVEIGPGGIALLRLGLLLGLVALWWILSVVIDRSIIPSPAETVAAAGRLIAEGSLQTALTESLSIFAGGYTAAAAVAIPLGVLMGAVVPLGRTLEIYVYALSATPRVAFIPLIIVILGLGAEAKIFVVFLGAVMPMLINTYAGVRQADTDLLEMARTVGASRLRAFVRIVLPGAVPFVVTGLRLGATIGLINTIVAELYTAVSGLGGLLAIYGNTFRMAEYFVIVLTLAFVGVVLTEVLRYVETRLSRWKLRN